MLPRYAVTRTLNDGWAVVDRHVSKIRMHNDIIERFPTRDAARAKCQVLNEEDPDALKTSGSV